MAIPQAIKELIPQPLLKAIRDMRQPSSRQVFSRIYEYRAWGESGDPELPYYSGSGSHDGHVVSAYVQAVSGFLSSLERKPDVVDLGCGDFCVGSKIRPFCNAYVACDIVPGLIEFNKRKYAAHDVAFKVLDLTRDCLPAGDVVFIRQVLQHLSNRQIARAVKRLCSKYRYVVLTEHLPGSDVFAHNLDKRAGGDIRMAIGSGVVLTSPPFNLFPRHERILCQVPQLGGRIVTTLYQLSAS